MAATRGWDLNSLVGGAQGHRLIVLNAGTDSGNVLIAGGDGSTCEIYNVAGGTWSTTGSTTLTGDIHLVGPLSNNKILAWNYTSTTPQVFDPVAHTWSNTGNNPQRFNVNQHGQMTLLNDGTVLQTGGQSFQDTRPGTIYNPSSNTWANTTGNQIHGATQFAAAVLLNNGNVLIFGGNNSNSGVLATVDMYNPTTQTFTTVGSMTQARQYHIAMLLPNGNVWIYGGINNNSSEIYNVTTNTSTADVTTTFNGWWRPGTFLQNGKILLAGEAGGGGSAQTGVELYTPASLTLNGITLDDANGHSVTITAPQTVSANYTLLLPSAQSVANALLQNDGSGNLSFTTSPTLSSLSLSTPLPVLSGGTGTATPGLIAGTNITSITGTWPNQTINTWNYADNEAVSGTIDGVNKTFTLVRFPNGGVVHLYRNGTRQNPASDYQLIGQNVVFTTAPTVGDSLLVDYRY